MGKIMASTTVKTSKGYGLVETIIAISLGVLILSAFMSMLAAQRHRAVLLSEAQRDASIWFNFINAVENYAVNSNASNTQVSCSTLVSNNLISQNGCTDIFGNQLAGYIVSPGQVYAYIGSPSMDYSNYLQTLNIATTSDLQYFYRNILDIVSKLGESSNGQYDIFFVNNSNVYDMQYNIWTTWNGANIPFSLQSSLQSSTNPFPIMRLIVY